MSNGHYHNCVSNLLLHKHPTFSVVHDEVTLYHRLAPVQVTQESLFLTLTQGDTFAAAFASFLATVLGVDASHVEVTDLVVDPGTSITSTSQASITIRVDSLITPADSFSANQVWYCCFLYAQLWFLALAVCFCPCFFETLCKQGH